MQKQNMLLTHFEGLIYIIKGIQDYFCRMMSEQSPVTTYLAPLWSGPKLLLVADCFA